MDSTDRVWAIFWVCLFATIVVVTSTIAYNGRVNAPVKMQKQVLDARERMLCIKARGTWAATDNDNSLPYSCKI